MKRVVEANLIFDTPAKRNQLLNDLTRGIVDKPIWGAVSLNTESDMDGQLNASIVGRFDNKADGDDLFSFIKQRMDSIPILKGNISIHDCSHDEQPQPCVLENQYIK